MPIRKGLCPYCTSHSKIKQRILDIQTESDYLYCPFCGKRIASYEAIKYYDDEVKRLLYKAAFKLFVKGDASGAYDLYGQLINMDGDIIDAHYGRIISLIHCSKMHKSFINEALSIFESESISIFHKVKDKRGYTNFLFKIQYSIAEYLARIKRKVIIKKCFINKEYLEIYLTHINEALKFEKSILDEAIFTAKHFNDSKLDTLIGTLKKDIIEKESALVVPYRLLDGTQFSYNKARRNGEVVTKECGNKINTKLSAARIASINIKSKKLNYVKDDVFTNNMLKITICNCSFFFMIVFVLMTVILFALGFLSTINTLNYFLYLSSASLSAALAITLMVIFILLAKAIRKGKKRIN